MMRTSISTTCSRRGLTLIEVVAGLALMGTLVAAMLSAKSRFTGQYHHAQRVLIAVDALDALLLERWPALGEIDSTEYGVFDGQNMTWRTSVVEDRDAEAWHCRIIRVEVLDAADGSSAKPLARVELLSPDPTYQTQGHERDQAEPDSDVTEPPPSEHAPPKANEPAIPVRKERDPIALGVVK